MTCGQVIKQMKCIIIFLLASCNRKKNLTKQILIWENFRNNERNKQNKIKFNKKHNFQ